MVKVRVRYLNAIEYNTIHTDTDHSKGGRWVSPSVSSQSIKKYIYSKVTSTSEPAV